MAPGQAWASMLDSPTARGAAAGALGTVAMSLLMLAGLASGLSPMPEPVPKAIASALLPAGAPAPALVGLAVLGHLGYGAFWGAGLLARDPTPSARDGLLLGVGLWVLMGLVVLPALGWGLFGTAVTARIAVATLVLHLVYGGVLPAAASWLGRGDVVRSEAAGVS